MELVAILALFLALLGTTLLDDQPTNVTLDEGDAPASQR
jgi:hypothetical protein